MCGRKVLRGPFLCILEPDPNPENRRPPKGPSDRCIPISAPQVKLRCDMVQTGRRLLGSGIVCTIQCFPHVVIIVQCSVWQSLSRLGPYNLSAPYPHRVWKRVWCRDYRGPISRHQDRVFIGETRWPTDSCLPDGSRTPLPEHRHLR